MRQRLQMRSQWKHQDGLGSYESLVHQSSMLPVREHGDAAPQTDERPPSEKLPEFFDGALPSPYFRPKALVDFAQETEGEHCLPGEKGVPTSTCSWHVWRQHSTADAPLAKLVTR